jgi:hypothetical protein
LVARTLSWIGHHLESAFSGSVGGSALLVVAVLLVAAVAAAVWRASRHSTPGRRPGGAQPDPLQALAEVDHRARAEEFSAAGQHAQALREWLRAAVQDAERRGVIDPRPGRTGDEFAREAGLSLPAAADQLRAAAMAFDLVWFGGHRADAEGVATARAAADAVRAARIERPAHR